MHQEQSQDQFLPASPSLLKDVLDPTIGCGLCFCYLAWSCPAETNDCSADQGRVSRVMVQLLRVGVGGTRTQEVVAGEDAGFLPQEVAVVRVAPPV